MEQCLKCFALNRRIVHIRNQAKWNNVYYAVWNKVSQFTIQPVEKHILVLLNGEICSTPAANSPCFYPSCKGGVSCTNIHHSAFFFSNSVFISLCCFFVRCNYINTNNILLRHYISFAYKRQKSIHNIKNSQHSQFSQAQNPWVQKMNKTIAL